MIIRGMGILRGMGAWTGSAVAMISLLVFAATGPWPRAIDIASISVMCDTQAKLEEQKTVGGITNRLHTYGGGGAHVQFALPRRRKVGVVTN